MRMMLAPASALNTAKFNHLAELTGKLADNVLAAHKAAAE